MPSTFFGLSIGTSGLYASQASMNTAAHNIANSNTKGYTRQEANLQASTPISTNNSFGMLGTGVDATSITQIRNEYYDVKFRANTAISGNYSTKEHYFLSIENVFSETNSEGLSATFDQFYNALETLAGDVGDITKRTQVANMAQSFTEFVNVAAKNLESLQEDCNNELKLAKDQINSIAQQIANLNKQINTIEMSGQHANDLRDARNLLLDQLSEYANIQTEEFTHANGRSTTFIVRLDGQVLVDNYSYNTLKTVPRTTYFNQNDADGMYKLVWAETGQDFNETSETLGGKLQALFQIRDGNNGEALKGSATGAKGSKSLTVTGTNCNDLTKLNLPAQNGIMKVNNVEYEYDHFEVTVDADGNYTYNFTLKSELLEDVTDKSVTVGKSVNCKGIPYYMNQLTTFVRTFAQAFNEIHKKGEDLEGNKGVDFFTAKHPSSGADYSITNVEKDGTFSSLPSNSGNASYFHLNCKNFTVNSAIMDDPRKIAANKDRDNGIEDKEILNELIALKSDNRMFKAGTPDSFLQKIISDIGNDGKKATKFAKSQEGVVAAIENQRMSVSSVDQDEESMNLVKFQNAYNLSAKLIQTMNEMYGVLINGLGL